MTLPDPDALAARLAALCAAVRAQVDRRHPLCRELHLSAPLADLPVVDGVLRDWPPPAAWLDAWDAISREVAVLLRDEAEDPARSREDRADSRDAATIWGAHSDRVRRRIRAWRAAA